MMDVNSMAERGGNEVWFHRHMKSMVAMESDCGGRRLEVGVVRRQMVRSTHAAYFNIKSGVLENSTVCT